jgi:hypothetical protein
VGIDSPPPASGNETNVATALAFFKHQEGLVLLCVLQLTILVISTITILIYFKRVTDSFRHLSNHQRAIMAQTNHEMLRHLQRLVPLVHTAAGPRRRHRSLQTEDRVPMPVITEAEETPPAAGSSSGGGISNENFLTL